MTGRIGIALIVLGLLSSFLTVSFAHTRSHRIANTGRALLPISAIVFTGLHRDPAGLAQFSFVLSGSLILTEILKETVHEHRPYGYSHASFPSGHATWAFASAGFLHFRYGTAYAIPAYTLASMTAYARVHERRHYWRDVIASAGIGLLFNCLITQSFAEKHLTVMPYANTHSGGFILSLK